MDTKIYPVKIELLLKPIGTPRCLIQIGDQKNETILTEDSWFTFHCQGNGINTLSVIHQGKQDSDPTTAVIVESIKFDDISSPKFVYQGIYTPTYPKHLLGNKKTLNQNYLSWNGVWTLEFTLPIYTWIHKVENLGWIYD